MIEAKAPNVLLSSRESTVTYYFAFVNFLENKLIWFLSVYITIIIYKVLWRDITHCVRVKIILLGNNLGTFIATHGLATKQISPEEKKWYEKSSQFDNTFMPL